MSRTRTTTTKPVSDKPVVEQPVIEEEKPVAEKRKNVAKTVKPVKPANIFENCKECSKWNVCLYDCKLLCKNRDTDKCKSGCRINNGSADDITFECEYYQGK